jgi:hypothetical protein|tara:strand:- start:514 stop:726 length:213 start_codon:yes stop_codon:yes gene_type:complete
MKFESKIKTLGFKDMHEEQAQALLNLVDAALSLAAATECDTVFNQMHEIAEDTVILFGGTGIDVEFKADY